MISTQLIIGGFAAMFALGSLGFLAYTLLAPREDLSIRDLMGSRDNAVGGLSSRGVGGKQASDADLAKLKSQARKKAKKGSLSLEEKMFRAGIYEQAARADFDRLRIIAPLISLPVGAIGGAFAGVEFALVGAIMGLLIGFQIPFSILDRRVKARDEDILFYLPLVIEQLAIGVSSSLDIGPCIAKVVSMADERDSHNPVTELLGIVQYHVKSGVSLDEALNEVAVRAGSVEMKHAFMSLAQVSRHGGEITRQLQELADAIANQRETKIEAKIKKLELEATGPVALVFVGFLVILLIGFGIQVQQAFG